MVQRLQKFRRSISLCNWKELIESISPLSELRGFANVCVTLVDLDFGMTHRRLKYCHFKGIEIVCSYATTASRLLRSGLQVYLLYSK